MLNGSISSEEAILELRGGYTVEEKIGWTIIMALIVMIALNSMDQAEAFQVIKPPHHQLFGQKSPYEQYQRGPGFSSQSSQSQRLSLAVKGDFSEPTKEQKRNAPSPQDRRVKVDGHEEVFIRYGQAQKKVAKHGELFDLPYKLNAKNEPVTARTPANIKGYQDGMENLLHKPENIWIKDGKFQEGTPLEINTINVYNSEAKIVLIFKRDTGEFITSCKLDETESKILLETRNFGGPRNSKLWWPKDNNITILDNNGTILDNNGTILDNNSIIIENLNSITGNSTKDEL